MAEVLHGIVDGGVRMRAGDDANGRNRIPVASRGIISTNREFYAYHTPYNSTCYRHPVLDEQTIQKRWSRPYAKGTLEFFAQLIPSVAGHLIYGEGEIELLVVVGWKDTNLGRE